MDMLAQTSPSPAVEPDLSLLLHGVGSQGADVQVLWRSDLPETLTQENAIVALETLSMMPPASEEALQLTLPALRAILADVDPTGLSDVEGMLALQYGRSRERLPNVVCWRGKRDSFVGQVRDVAPGDTVVLPSGYGGIEKIAGKPPLPVDAGDIVARLYRGKRIVRLHPALVKDWFLESADEETITHALSLIQDLLKAIPDADNTDDATRDVVLAISQLPDIDPGVNEVLSVLAQNGMAYPYGGHETPSGLLLSEPINLLEDHSDEEDSSSLTREVGLESHCQNVGKMAASFAETLGIPSDLVKDVADAAAFHDTGKADPRFQSWLRGGNRIAVRTGAELLAKSSMRSHDRVFLERARCQSGYPRGARHECYSAAIANSNLDCVQDAADTELLGYLIGTHHGRGRPFFPVAQDPGTSIRCALNGFDIEWQGYHGLERLDSGWPNLFWMLTRRYGYWGLALLETIVRQADHQQSRIEAEG
jgi:CRISPR-associated endonuclease/helicase Cas3